MLPSSCRRGAFLSNAAIEHREREEEGSGVVVSNVLCS
jgi:hypothetical protein